MTDHEAALAATLRNTLRALNAHIDDDAKRDDVPRAHVCPCVDDEAAKAAAVLAEHDARAAEAADALEAEAAAFDAEADAAAARVVSLSQKIDAGGAYHVAREAVARAGREAERNAEACRERATRLR